MADTDGKPHDIGPIDNLPPPPEPADDSGSWLALGFAAFAVLALSAITAIPVVAVYVAIALIALAVYKVAATSVQAVSDTVDSLVGDGSDAKSVAKLKKAWPNVIKVGLLLGMILLLVALVAAYTWNKTRPKNRG